MKKPSAPVKSISTTFLGWVIPAWWPWLLVLGGLDVFWFTHLEQVDSLLNAFGAAFIPGVSLPGKAEISFLPFMLGAGCLMLLLFMLLTTHRGPPSETAVFPDRLELFDGKSRRSVYWQDIIVQDQGELDIWSETIGSGKSSYSVIRMDVRNGRQRLPLRLCYHLNPAGRAAPDFRNKAAVKRAWLETLLRARPELRVDLGIYASCKISPATLEYSLRNTLLLWAGGAVGLLTFAATAYAIADTPGNLSAGRLISTIFGGIATTTLVLILLDKTLGKYLFILPESPAVRAARRRRLGPDTPNPPTASAYPLVDPDGGKPPNYQTLSSRRRQRHEELIAKAAIPADYPWDELEGDDWYLLLDQRPDFAPYCRWQLLDGEAWAMLLPEHPEWAEHCAWRKLETGDWADLIAAAPQFDATCFQHIGWKDFDGTDWAGLLASRPELLPHCDLKLLDADNWAYLLLFQPDLAQHCPLKPLPKGAA